jgi:hypothetical protein
MVKKTTWLIWSHWPPLLRTQWEVSSLIWRFKCWRTYTVDWFCFSFFLSFFVFGAGTRLRHDENGHVVQGQFVEHRHNVIQFDQKPLDVLKKNLFLHFLQNIVTCFFCGIERKKSRILLF